MIVKVEIIHDVPEKESEFKAFKGDELTSAISEAIIYLQEKQQEELEL